jgi:CDP-diacylglycerol--glycerol-3-phosphate 3-phosphatidyltransferase
MFDGRWRASVQRGLQPVGSGLRRTGISADQLTAAGLLFAVATAATVAAGHPAIGCVLLVASSLPDLLDGAVAKASGTVSARGAFFDSVTDRVSDALVLGGTAWYVASRWGAHTAVLALAVLAASMLVSYERAKADALGFDARGGLMERAERIVLLAVGLTFSFMLVLVLWVMLGLTAFTAVQRFVKVWRQGDGSAAARRAPMSVGWRGWPRTSRAARPRTGAWRRRARSRP